MQKPYFMDTEQLYNDVRNLVRHPHDSFFIDRLFEILEFNAPGDSIGWVNQVPDNVAGSKALLGQCGITFADLEEIFEDEFFSASVKAVVENPRDFVQAFEKSGKFLVMELGAEMPLHNFENWDRVVACMPKAALIKALKKAVENLEKESGKYGR